MEPPSLLLKARQSDCVDTYVIIWNTTVMSKSEDRSDL